MAVSIEIGAIECNNPSCFNSIDSIITSFDIFTKDESRKQSFITTLMQIFNMFPTHNFPKKFGKKYWKLLYYIFYQLPKAPHLLIGKVLTNLSKLELFSYFSDIEEIITAYIDRKPLISFKTENLKRTEALVDLERTGQEEPKTNEKIDWFYKQVALEDADARIALIISSLRCVKDRVFGYSNLAQLVGLVRSCMRFDALRSSCQRFLLSINEMSLNELDQVSTLESSEISHLSPIFLIELTKSLLSASKPCESLAQFSIELLKQGISPQSLQNLKPLTSARENHPFAWHYIRSFMGGNFNSYGPKISAFLKKKEKRGKKLKNSENSSPSFKITDLNLVKSLDLGELLIETCNSGDPVLMNFFRGLTGLDVFKIEEDNQNIKDFLAFSGFAPPTTLGQIIDAYINNFRSCTLPKTLSTVSPLTIYKTLCLIPANIIINNSAPAIDYVKVVLKSLTSGELFKQFNRSRESKAEFKDQFLIDGITKALVRALNVASLESEIKKMKNLEILIGFETRCPYCGTTCKEFCFNCFLRKMPVVVPGFKAELFEDFQVVSRQFIEIKAKPSKVSIDYLAEIGNSIQVIRDSLSSHDCLTCLANKSLISSCLIVKHSGQNLDFFPDSFISSLVLPTCILTPENKTFLLEHLYISKSTSLKLLESSPVPVLPFETLSLICQIIIWPTENPILLSLTQQNLEILKSKYKFSLQDIFSFISRKNLSIWTEKVSKTIGFIDFLKQIQDFNLVPYLPKVQVKLLLKHKLQKVFHILKRFFKEYNDSDINLFYTQVIVGVAWANNENKLKDLEELCGILLRKPQNSRVALEDLFGTSAKDEMNEAKIFLVCELGLGKVINQWIYECKTGKSEVSIPKANVEKFFYAFNIIEGVYKTTEHISQNINNLATFDWTEFFKLASTIDTIALPSKEIIVNCLIGISNLCFYFNEKKENEKYLSAKIISICGHLLEIDRNLMIQILESFIKSFKLEKHYTAVLALAFIAREDKRAQLIIETVIEKIDKNELKANKRIHFMMIFQESSCFNKLRDYLKENNENPILSYFDSLQSSLCTNLPLIQYAALSLIPYIISNNFTFPFEKLILALNKANSMLSARHHTGELPFSLGMKIDSCIGLVGAHYCLEPIENSYKIHIDLIITCENFYSNIERLYLAQLMMENDQNCNEVVEVLKNLFFHVPRYTQEVTWTECKSLREWTQVLIYTYKAEHLYPSIPLVQVNLDTLTYILPIIFQENIHRIDYFVEYLNTFFENSPATYRRLMLKVIENCPELKSKLPVSQMLRQYIELNEYPRALFLLESSIRARINNLNERYKPKLITKEELDYCKIVFQGLYANNYLNSIPKQFKDSQEHEKEYLKLMKLGYYDVLANRDLFPVFKLAARWRLDMTADVKLATDINSCLAYILKSEDKGKASEEVKNFLIRNSGTRIADFCQAYEHVLIQHFIENINGTLSGKYSYIDIKKRNKVIQDKFEYKEMALRVSLVLAKQMKNVRVFVSVVYDLFRLAFIYRNFTYCKNFLIYLKSSENFMVQYPLISRFIAFKMLLLTKEINKKSLDELVAIWSILQNNLDSDEKLGSFSNIRLKYKVGVLIIKTMIFMSVKNEKLEELEGKYLAYEGPHYEEIRLSLEKGYCFLADHLYNSCFSHTGDIIRAKASKVCLLYYKSLKHGHHLYLNSSTRLIRLFFLICNEIEKDSYLIDCIIDLGHNLPLFIWADRVSQLISCARTLSPDGKNLIKIIFSRLLNANFSQMIWYIGPYIVSQDLRLESRPTLLRSIFDDYCKDTGLSTGFTSLANFFESLVAVSKNKQSTSLQHLFINPTISIAFPCKENFNVLTRPKRENLWGRDEPGFTKNPILIKKFLTTFERYKSKATPAKLQAVCSDGTTRIILCKQENKLDMRKEERITQIIDYINKFLAQDPECRQLNIQLPSYIILFIGKESVVVEWVNETSTIMSIQKKYNKTKLAEESKHSDHTNWNLIQKKIRPSLHKYFTDSYQEPNDWLKARNNFTRSLAAWSMFGYVIGLGDRHTDNIMIKNKTGELMFIDFECIFGHGKILNIPEKVPFRLTPDFQDAMGLFFEQGEFMKTCNIVLRCMKKNIVALMIQFESFVIDPISSRIINPDISSKNADPQDTLKIVRSKLEGVKDYMAREVFESDKEQVKFLTEQATDSEILRAMYVGWKPWE